MGANDVCFICWQPLDFFDYYVYQITKMNGPAEQEKKTVRICEVCNAHILAQANHE